MPFSSTRMTTSACSKGCKRISSPEVPVNEAATLVVEDLATNSLSLAEGYSEPLRCSLNLPNSRSHNHDVKLYLKRRRHSSWLWCRRQGDIKGSAINCEMEYYKGSRELKISWKMETWIDKITFLLQRRIMLTNRAMKWCRALRQLRTVPYR